MPICGRESGARKYRSDPDHGRNDNESHQGRNKFPSGEKEHEKRPRQIELLLQCKGPVVPNDGVIETDRPRIPQMMIVESESRSRKNRPIRHGDPSKVRQGENHQNVKIEAWEDSQCPTDVELFPIKSLAFLILPHTERVDEISAQKKKDADTQCSISSEEAERRKKPRQRMPEVLQENQRDRHAPQTIQTRNSTGSNRSGGFGRRQDTDGGGVSSTCRQNVLLRNLRLIFFLRRRLVGQLGPDSAPSAIKAKSFRMATPSGTNRTKSRPPGIRKALRAPISGRNDQGSLVSQDIFHKQPMKALRESLLSREP